jgi:hypothetical protein
MRSRAVAGSLLAGSLVALLLALPTGALGASSAEEVQAQIRARESPGSQLTIKIPPPANPGEVCNTNATTAVFRSQTGTEVLYVVAAGTPMRIEAYAGPEEYYGHAQGKANGYFYRYLIDQSTCHKT